MVFLFHLSFFLLEVFCKPMKHSLIVKCRVSRKEETDVGLFGNNNLLSLGAVIAIFSGIIFNGEKIVGSKNLLPSSSSTLSLYHLDSTFIGILLTFSPMHFLGFNVMPRRIPDFPDSFHSWNFLSSIGSGITFLSFAMLMVTYQ